MVNIIEAIILGIVQGITEWLPISSSGHLVLFQNLFGMEQPVIFDIMLHLGSLIVIFMVFWKDIKKIIKGVFALNMKDLKYCLYIMIATIPIGLIGVFLNDLIKSIFNSIITVGISLLITSALLFSTRIIKKEKRKKNKNIGWKSALMIGCGQALAILPGVSRSGSTISTGLLQGINHKEVAKFSFLMFIPAIIGATVFEFNELNSITNIPAIIAGVIAAIISGYLSLSWLLKIIEKNKFHLFGWYCLILGIIILLVGLL